MFNKKTLTLIILSLLLLTSYSPVGSNLVATMSKVDCNSPEYLLASECKDQPTKSTDFRIKRLKYILCELESKCCESRKDIANTILWGYDVVTKDYKKDLTLINFAEGLNGYVTYSNSNDLDQKVQEYLSFLNN